MNQFLTGKRIAKIKMLLKLLYTSQSCTWKKHYNNLLVRPSVQLFLIQEQVKQFVAKNMVKMLYRNSTIRKARIN